MTADRLRRAAAQIREDVAYDTRVLEREGMTWLKVADWLEHEASYVERHLASDGTTKHALAVANAYLGADS